MFWCFYLQLFRFIKTLISLSNITKPSSKNISLIKVFCFHLNSKSYPIIVPDVFPLVFLRLVSLSESECSNSFLLRKSCWKKYVPMETRPIRYENWNGAIAIPYDGNSIIFTLLCGASKAFMKAFNKPFEAPQGSVKIKISVIFLSSSLIEVGKVNIHFADMVLA